MGEDFVLHQDLSTNENRSLQENYFLRKKSTWDSNYTFRDNWNNHPQSRLGDYVNPPSDNTVIQPDERQELKTLSERSESSFEREETLSESSERSFEREETLSESSEQNPLDQLLAKNPKRDPRHDWVFCDSCEELNAKILIKDLYLCEYCKGLVKMESSARVALLIDPRSWYSIDGDMAPLDPIPWDGHEFPPMHEMQEGVYIELDTKEDEKSKTDAFAKRIDRKVTAANELHPKRTDEEEFTDLLPRPQNRTNRVTDSDRVFCVYDGEVVDKKAKDDKMDNCDNVADVNGVDNRDDVGGVDQVFYDRRDVAAFCAFDRFDRLDGSLEDEVDSAPGRDWISGVRDWDSVDPVDHVDNRGGLLNRFNSDRNSLLDEEFAEFDLELEAGFSDEEDEENPGDQKSPFNGVVGVDRLDDPLSNKVDEPLDPVDDPLDKVDDPLSKVDEPLDPVDDPLDKVEDPKVESDWDSEGDEEYGHSVDYYQKETGLAEAIQTGIGQLNGIPLAFGVMDFGFIAGTLGCSVGEKITRLIEYATNQSLPLIMVCASGGARVQEGTMALLQMAKIAHALYKRRQSNPNLLYIALLASATTGGVLASFAMLGNIVIAEPEADVAFTGKRVIEEVLKKEVPEDEQVAEVLFEHGAFDQLLPRHLLKSVLSELLKFHGFLPLNSNSLK